MPKTAILDAIGSTPLVELKHLRPSGGARIFVKLESANPTGSMKDRMAKAMIDGAEREGTLTPGREVVEFTGGSTGTSLAFICAARGYPLFVVTSDAFSLEKRRHMQAFGATVTLEPSVNGMVTPDLFVRMRAATQRIIQERGAFWTNQFENHHQAQGYHALADEVWAQTGGRVDAFVHAVGTGGSFRGSVTRLRHHNPSIKTYAVEPSTSAVLSGGTAGAHRLEGMGTGRIPPMWDASLATGYESVSSEDAEAMARRLTKEEAIFAGTSTGANVIAAMRVSSQLSPDSIVVTLAVDSGLKYLTTEVYR